MSEASPVPLRPPHEGTSRSIFAGAPRPSPPAKSAAEKRRDYFDLALMMRGKRDEPVEETIARAERIRDYVENGVTEGVSLAPCSPGSSGEAPCSSP